MVLEKVIELLAEYKECDSSEIKADSTFDEMELDSLDKMCIRDRHPALSGVRQGNPPADGGPDGGQNHGAAAADQNPDSGSDCARKERRCV